jgi:hypothetical protein
MTMKNADKIRELCAVKGSEKPVDYYNVLGSMGDLKYNYADYMITGPVEAEVELERLPNASYDLCCALMTMMLREDHFDRGRFQLRCRKGQVDSVLKKMTEILSQQT